MGSTYKGRYTSLKEYGTHIWYPLGMDRHRSRGRTVRPEPAEAAAAEPHLDGRTWEDLLRAALRALAAEPDRTLALLEPYWPASRRRGRPRKSAPPSSGGGAR
jgi:hypothetical protein